MCNILLLQETWHNDFDLSLCNSVHKDFYEQGLSSVNTNISPLTGRLHEGLAILFCKHLGISYKICTHDEKCLVDIEFTDNRKMKYLFDERKERKKERKRSISSVADGGGGGGLWQSIQNIGKLEPTSNTLCIIENLKL